jgi:hypothetical protein
MSISALSISEDTLPIWQQSVQPISDLGDLTTSNKLKKNVDQSWVEKSFPDVDRGSPPA